jgi:hypothetical protein
MDADGADAPTGLRITAQGWPRNEAYPGINVRENLYPNGVVSGGVVSGGVVSGGVVSGGVVSGG